MQCGSQALFGEDTENKLPVQIAKRKLILQAVGDDAPSQMAQLLALEYLTGVTDTDRLTQVSMLPVHSCTICAPVVQCCCHLSIPCSAAVHHSFNASSGDPVAAQDTQSCELASVALDALLTPWSTPAMSKLCTRPEGCWGAAGICGSSGFV